MPDSNISITSIQYRRRRKQSSVLKRIICLKRRCIRCYFVLVLLSIIHLGIAAHIFFANFDLIYSEYYLFCTLCIFLASTILMLVGSITSIYALTKKLDKVAFFIGNFLMATALILNIVSVVLAGFAFEHKGKSMFGYPQDMIEDCQNYPDHIFAFIVSPASRKGRPILVDLDENEDQYFNEKRTSLSRSSASTTEKVVTESYNCEEMLANIKWFKITYYFIIVFLVLTSITLLIAYIGIINLCFINSKGPNYSIIPMSLVEPYEFYDELLRSYSRSSMEKGLTKHPTKMMTTKTTRLLTGEKCPCRCHEGNHPCTIIRED